MTVGIENYGDAALQRRSFDEAVAPFRRHRWLILTVGLVVATFAVIGQALTSFHPPRNPAGLVPALLLGLAVGVVVAWIRDAADRSVRGPDALEWRTGLPVVAAIPKASWSQHHTALVEQEASPQADAYDELCARLNRAERPLRTLQVTSPADRDGKTGAAVNLAVSFALAGDDTVLIDLDFHRPRVHRFFPIKHDRGLATTMVDGDFEGVIWSVEAVEGLCVAFAGVDQGESATLLTDDRIEWLIGQLREEFDVVVVDSPPVLEGNQALRVANACDGSILVVSPARTKTMDAEIAAKRLRRSNTFVCGTLIDGFCSSTTGYSYRKYRTRLPDAPVAAPVGGAARRDVAAVVEEALPGTPHAEAEFGLRDRVGDGIPAPAIDPLALSNTGGAGRDLTPPKPPATLDIPAVVRADADGEAGPTRRPESSIDPLLFMPAGADDEAEEPDHDAVDQAPAGPSGEQPQPDRSPVLDLGVAEGLADTMLQPLQPSEPQSADQGGAEPDGLGLDAGAGPVGEPGRRDGIDELDAAGDRGAGVHGTVANREYLAPHRDEFASTPGAGQAPNPTSTEADVDAVDEVATSRAETRDVDDARSDRLIGDPAGGEALANDGGDRGTFDGRARLSSPPEGDTRPIRSAERAVLERLERRLLLIECGRVVSDGEASRRDHTDDARIEPAESTGDPLQAGGCVRGETVTVTVQVTATTVDPATPREQAEAPSLDQDVYRLLGGATDDIDEHAHAAPHPGTSASSTAKKTAAKKTTTKKTTAKKTTAKKTTTKKTAAKKTTAKKTTAKKTTAKKTTAKKTTTKKTAAKKTTAKKATAKKTTAKKTTAKKTAAKKTTAKKTAAKKATAKKATAKKTAAKKATAKKTAAKKATAKKATAKKTAAKKATAKKTAAKKATAKKTTTTNTGATRAVAASTVPTANLPNDPASPATPAQAEAAATNDNHAIAVAGEHRQPLGASRSSDQPVSEAGADATLDAPAVAHTAPNPEHGLSQPPADATPDSPGTSDDQAVVHPGTSDIGIG